MSGQPSSPAPPIRNSEDKLYQVCLNACIEGIESFAVDKKRGCVNPNNTITPTTCSVANKTPNSASARRATTPPSQQHLLFSLISPPATPRRVDSPRLVRSPTFDATMNRSSLHGAPVRNQVPSPRGPARGLQSAYGNQDARGNLAVQPAANFGSLKLKKTAVKIVSAPASISPFRAASAGPITIPVAGSSPGPAPLKTKPNDVDRPESITPATKPKPPIVAPNPVSATNELPASRVKEESALDDLFARLNARKSSTPPHSAIIKAESPAHPEHNQFSPENQLGTEDTPTQLSCSYTAKLPNTHVKVSEGKSEVTAVAAEKKPDVTKVVKTNQAMSNKPWKDLSQAEFEQLYLRKAVEYLNALPSGNNIDVHTIKIVSQKLRSSYTPNTKLSPDEINKLKARYAFAIVTYINQIYKKSSKSITSEFIRKVLQDSDGNLLDLCTILAEEKYLSLDDIDGIIGLCKIIMDVLPKAESIVAPVLADIKPIASTTNESKPMQKEPIDEIKVWPEQKKRETPAPYRACVLKGVSGVKNINELQALVWGGGLESIVMPAPGSNFAVVRFLTPDACDKYFKATENGIEIPGDKKTVIFVEKQPSPTSINDVMRNCTESGASRCVRALDAEEDWSDTLLMKLARGKGALKREVDRIKRGRTARGRHYVEFRFANIYHALNFKRQLVDDQEWEPCTITYATDPCETASGVHYKDEDEEGAGFFA